MALGGAVAVVRVVDARISERGFAHKRIKGRRDVRVGPPRRLEVVAKVRGEGVALRQGCGAGVLLVRALALLLAFASSSRPSLRLGCSGGGSAPGRSRETRYVTSTCAWRCASCLRPFAELCNF